ncbi:hypothetical protein LY78DRAFT_477349 [Colletotrichum sublineola]|nr:hypothetical protein LY78DRAFT_477349 [Colletotrichum sublineola]
MIMTTATIVGPYFCLDSVPVPRQAAELTAVYGWFVCCLCVVPLTLCACSSHAPLLVWCRQSFDVFSSALLAPT